MCLLSLVVLAAIFTGCKTTEAFDTRIYVPEEGGVTFTKITEESSDQLIVPRIKINYGLKRLTWWVNPYFAITNDGKMLAYISSRNDKSNIFVKSLVNRGGSQQRTFQGGVQDVAFSPDGSTICFTKRNEQFSNSYSTIYENLIFTTSATQGSIVRQISTPNSKDFGVKYSTDGTKLFFSRLDGNSYTIWSHELENGTLSNYCMGTSPCPMNDEEFLCVRENSTGNCDIWLVNYVKGSESLVLGQDGRSFTTPSMSPDGKWILCVSNTKGSNNTNENLDVYVVRSDGSQLTQLTYHRGNDLSPVWSPDGKSIYFLSQRGSAKGEYNIWKMNFNL